MLFLAVISSLSVLASAGESPGGCLNDLVVLVSPGWHVAAPGSGIEWKSSDPSCSVATVAALVPGVAPERVASVQKMCQEAQLSLTDLCRTPLEADATTFDTNLGPPGADFCQELLQAKEDLNCATTESPSPEDCSAGDHSPLLCDQGCLLQDGKPNVFCQTLLATRRMLKLPASSEVKPDLPSGLPAPVAKERDAAARKDKGEGAGAQGDGGKKAAKTETASREKDPGGEARGLKEKAPAEQGKPEELKELKESKEQKEPKEPKKDSIKMEAKQQQQQQAVPPADNDKQKTVYSEDKLINHMRPEPKADVEGYGHFFSYFFVLMVAAIVFYLLLHNKNKLIALFLEGRRRKGGRGGRDRSRSSQYRKLDNNLEEAMGPESDGSFKQMIY